MMRLSVSPSPFREGAGSLADIWRHVCGARFDLYSLAGFGREKEWIVFSLTGMVLMGGWVSEKLNGVEMDCMALRMAV